MLVGSPFLSFMSPHSCFLHLISLYCYTSPSVCLYVFSSGQLARLEEDVSESQKHNRHKHTSVMTVTSTTLGSSAQKKQVKRRHRRKRTSCAALDCVEANAKQEQTDRSDRSLSPDRRELGEKRERSSRSRRELPPRLRCSGAPQSDSSSEEAACREVRSWSKEKARRVRRRSGGSRERNEPTEGKEGEDKTEVMELQSVGSDEGKENQPLVEDRGGLKKRHSSRALVKGDGHSSQREGSESREKSYKSHSPEGSSSLAEDAKELITKRYQEKGSGGGDMSVPTPQNHCGVNGGTMQPFSDDSELEVCRSVRICEPEVRVWLCAQIISQLQVQPLKTGNSPCQGCKKLPLLMCLSVCVCRICHCEGDDECPLIMPCRCTGSLSFVHPACLNQWIKSSDTRCCELCKFDFIMETKLKPLRKVGACSESSS